MSRPPIDISQRSNIDDAEPQSRTTEIEERVSDEPEAGDEPITPLRSVRAQVEIKAIMAALKHTGWNRKQAARLLKISYRGLLYKIRRHNITAA